MDEQMVRVSQGAPVGLFGFIGLFLLFEVVSSLVLAFSGNMNIYLQLFGLLLWGCLYLNLFILKRSLADFMNWYIAYWLVYFYAGYFRNMVNPTSFAPFAASPVSLDPAMLRLSIMFAGIYVSIAFGVYAILGKRLRVNLPLVPARNGVWLAIVFWALAIAKAYLLSLGFLRMGEASRSNSLMSVVNMFTDLIPVLSAYLFFRSRSRWNLVYPVSVCLLSFMAASKAAILNVLLIYMMFYLVQGGFTIRRLPAARKLVLAGIIVAVGTWVTSAVVYPLVIAYRTSGSILEAYAAVRKGPRTAYISALGARIQGADNLTLLVQSVYEFNEPHVNYFDTINAFNYLLPRSVYPNKPAYTIGNLYTTRIAGYGGDYSFSVLVTDVGEAFYYFGVWGIFLVPALMGLIYSVGSMIVARVKTDRDVVYYVLLISSLSNPAEMFLEYKVYSFVIGYVLLRGLFALTEVFRMPRRKRVPLPAGG